MIVASINARMGSTRLPGKALADIEGKPLLSRLLARVRLAQSLDGIILATTTNVEDDVLEEWAEKEGVRCHRGSEKDVLQRTIDAHTKMGSEIVVRVCGDTPLIDPELIDRYVHLVAAGYCDIAMASKNRSYPHGISAHVCKMKDLVELNKTTTDPILREHVTLYLYESGKYKVHEFKGSSKWACEGQRLQVDYPEDLDVARMIYARLGTEFSISDIVFLLKREPWIRGLNGHCEEKPVR